MKIWALLLLIPLLSPVNYVLEVENNSVYGDACRYNIQGWIYVHIEGEPYDRGYQHGYLLYAEIADMIYRWSNVIHNAPFIPHALSADVNSSRYENLSAAFWNQCRRLAMNIFWGSYPEEYKQEVRGIADGAKARGVEIYGRPITYEDILAMNEMYELMSIMVNPQKSVHLLRDVVNALSNIFPSLSGSEEELASAFSFSHHCNGFAAVGDATKDGNIVISDTVWCGGWWYTYYIAQRWNIILDIEPSQGHRMLIATSPGLIWSDEDYYQTDEGLAMIETTFVQGVYKLSGMPLAIRARMAMQYGDTIDDVISYMLTENTGVMNAQWLIADAEAREIALLEFGLYASHVERTKDGFLWSANNPFDFRVRREVLGYEVIKAPIFRMAHLLLNATGYQYYTLFYTPSERDIKFEELGNEYYGSIDADAVKIIMHTPPMTDFTTDCKITDGSMIFNNSLWAFWGNPTRVWNTSGLETLKGARDVPPAGWVEIRGVPYDFTPRYEKGTMGRGAEAKVLWSYPIGERNCDYATLAAGDRIVYASFESTLYALTENGSLLWQKELDDAIRDIAADESGVYVATDSASYAFSPTGTQMWRRAGGKDIAVGKEVYVSGPEGVYGENKVSDTPADFVTYDRTLYIASGSTLLTDSWQFEAEGTLFDVVVKRNVYAGSADGNLYCLGKDGTLKWTYTAGWGIVDVEVDDAVYAGSADGNLYCLGKDGTLKWTFSSNASIHHITKYGDFIFFGSSDGRLYAINRTTGKAAFSFAPAYEIEGTYNYITTPVASPVVATNGKVMFSAAGTIYCLDARTVEKDTGADGHGMGGTPLIWGIAALVLIAAGIALFMAKRKKRMDNV